MKKQKTTDTDRAGAFELDRAGAKGAEAKVKFEKLPRNCQQYIFQFVDLNTRARFLRVCKQIQQVVLAPAAWPANLELTFGQKLVEHDPFIDWFFKHVQPVPRCRSLNLGPYAFLISSVHRDSMTRLFSACLKTLTFVLHHWCLTNDTFRQAASSLERIEGPTHVCAPWLPQMPCLRFARLQAQPEPVELSSNSLTELVLVQWHSLPTRIDLPRLQKLTIEVSLFECDDEGGPVDMHFEDIFHVSKTPLLREVRFVDGPIEWTQQFLLAVHARFQTIRFERDPDIEDARDTFEDFVYNTICQLVDGSWDYLKTSQLEQIEIDAGGFDDIGNADYLFSYFNQMPKLRRLILHIRVEDLENDEVVDFLLMGANIPAAVPCVWKVLKFGEQLSDADPSVRILQIMQL